MATQRVIIQIQQRGGAQTERAIRRVGGAARAAQQAVNGFRNVLVALAAVSAAKGLVDFIDTVTRTDNKLRLLTDTQTQLNAAFNDVLSAANRTRSDLESTVELYSRLQRSTVELGLSQREIIDLTVGVNQAFQIFGATATEASAAVIQFSQGLSAGALRGDELRSVLEQGPRLAKAIADGLTEIEAFGPGTRTVIGDLRDLGKEGALTADLITRALATQLDELEAEFNETTPTLNQAFKRLQNTFLEALRSTNEATGFIDGLVAAVLSLESVVRGAGEAFQGLVTGVQGLQEVSGPAVVTIAQFLEGLVGASGAATGFDSSLGGIIETAGAAGIALFALAGPLGLLAGAILGTVSAIGVLRDSQTELTAQSRVVAEQIQLEFDNVTSLTKALDENSIITVQQARLKLAEAQARRENILSIRDEAQSRRDALRAELEDILARAQALQDKRSNVPILGALANLDENAALIGLEGQAKNAFEVFRQLDQQVRGFDQALADNASNIERVNALLADGSTLVDVSTEAQKAATEAQKAANDALKEATELAERQANNLATLNAEIDLIRISAGTGADALEDIASKLDQVTKAETLNRISAEGALQVRERLAGLVLPAQNQAFDDLIANLEEERRLLGLSAEEQALFNAAKAAGLELNNLSGSQLDDLRQEIELTKQLTEAQKTQEETLRRQAALGEQLTGNTALYNQQLTDLQALLSAGVISQSQFANEVQRTNEQLAVARLEAGAGNFADALTASLVTARGEFTNVANELSSTFGSALSSVKTGFADAFASAIVDGEDLNESLKAVAREGLKQLISGIIQLGIQYLLNQAISQTIAQAAVASNAQIAAQLALAYAPAAAAASLASFGANAGPAIAGIAATNAVSLGFASVPAFRDGTDFFNGPGDGLSDSGLARLSRGEGVVTARANAENPGAVAAMNRGERVGGQTTVNFVFPNGNPDTFRKNRRQLEREARLSINKAR